MATDNTPPRLRLIATIGIIVLITLFGLDFVFKSYYAFMVDEAQHEKLAPRTELFAQTTAERGAFESAQMPLSQAFSKLRTQRSALIEPLPSDDTGALTGWGKLSKLVPAAEARKADLPAIGASVDAGSDSRRPGAGGGAQHENVSGGQDAGAPIPK